MNTDEYWGVQYKRYANTSKKPLEPVSTKGIWEFGNAQRGLGFAYNYHTK